jgi:ribosome recycling factor
MNKFIQAKEQDLGNVILYFKKDIANLRTGRANPALLDSVLVEAYGAKSPLNTVGNITVSDARSLIVSPWDRSVLKEIEKGIVEANLGVGVVNEGDKIRVSIPLMTEENRKDLVKKLNEKMEKSRVNFRQVREDIKSDIEQAEDDKEISEDDRFKFIKELDEEIRKQNERLKTIRDEKEKEIMTI